MVYTVSLSRFPGSLRRGREGKRNRERRRKFETARHPDALDHICKTTKGIVIR